MAVAVLALTAPPAAAAGTGYVSHERSHTVAVLDPAQDHAIIAEIATSHRPRDMHFDRAHELLYVACGDDDVIDVIDVASLEVVDHIPTGISPEVFDLSPDGKTLYVSEEESALVRQIDLATKETVSQMRRPAGSRPTSWWARGRGGSS